MDIILMSVIRGVVIGTGFFFDFILIGLLYHELAKRHYWRSLKEKSKELGLRYEQSKYYHEFGSFHDEHDGYRSAIRIDSSGTVTTGVYIEIESDRVTSIERLELNHPRPMVRPSDEEEDFTTSNRLFNHIFKTRRADKKTAARFSKSSELLEAFVKFYTKWMFRLHYIQVDFPRGFLQCKLNYGNAWIAYIPPRALKTILSDMYVLMEKLEKVFEKS